MPVGVVEHQVAQKLHAASAPGSSRAHDLVDLQLLMTGEVDLLSVRTTCERLFQYRHKHAWPPALLVNEEGQTPYASASPGVANPGIPPQLGPPKTGSSLRTVPVPDFVSTALAQHQQAFPVGPFGVLFTNKRGCVVNRQSLHRSFRYALRTAELPITVTFHQLRHTYASLLIEAGESPTVVAARLGHKNATETLQTYSHLWPSSEDQTRLVLSRAFENADFSRTAEDPHPH